MLPMNPRGLNLMGNGQRFFFDLLLVTRYLLLKTGKYHKALQNVRDR